MEIKKKKPKKYFIKFAFLTFVRFYNFIRLNILSFILERIPDFSMLLNFKILATY